MKRTFTLILRFVQNIFSPQTEKVELYSYRFNLLVLIVAIIAAYFGYEQLRGFSIQLEELNARSKIELKAHFATSTISIGPDFTEPIEMTIVARNTGTYNTQSFGAVVMFCTKAKIVNHDSSWKKLDNNIFFYQSDEKVLLEQSFFNDDIDSLGIFKVIFSVQDYLANREIIPIGLFITYGEKADQIQTFAYLDQNVEHGVRYEPFLVNDGKILTDVHGCWSFLEN